MNIHALDDIYFRNSQRRQRVARFTVAVGGCHHSAWARNPEIVYRWARHQHRTRCELIRTIRLADAAVSEAMKQITQIEGRKVSNV
jgi:hypothetical protein